MSVRRRFSYEEEENESERIQELVDELVSLLGEDYRQIILQHPQRVAAPVSKLERLIETLRGERINELFGEPIRYLGEETLYYPGTPLKRRSGVRIRGGAHKLTSHPVSPGSDAVPTPDATPTDGGTEPPQSRDKEQAP